VISRRDRCRDPDAAFVRAIRETIDEETGRRDVRYLEHGALESALVICSSLRDPINLPSGNSSSDISRAKRDRVPREPLRNHFSRDGNDNNRADFFCFPHPALQRSRLSLVTRRARRQLRALLTNYPTIRLLARPVFPFPLSLSLSRAESGTPRNWVKGIRTRMLSLVFVPLRY